MMVMTACFSTPNPLLLCTPVMLAGDIKMCLQLAISCLVVNTIYTCIQFLYVSVITLLGELKLHTLMSSGFTVIMITLQKIKIAKVGCPNSWYLCEYSMPT